MELWIEETVEANRQPLGVTNPLFFPPFSKGGVGGFGIYLLYRVGRNSRLQP